MYNDRGLIKWAPFDALVGFRSSIEQISKMRNKSSQPILSEDQMADLNQTLSQVIYGKTCVDIEYYEAGYFKRISAIIMKVDEIKKAIILEYKIAILTHDIIRFNII